MPGSRRVPLAILLLTAAPVCPQSTIRPPAAPRNQQSLSPVSLNHLFLVLDPQTYAEILKSEFLRTEFAPMEVRSNVRADRVYRANYIYGAATYLELLHPEEAAPLGFKPSDSGLALGLEESGAILDLQSKMASKFPSRLSTVTRKYSDEQLPWFYSAEPKEFPFATWVMEYHPSFLAQWNPSTIPSANEGISRSLILDRYKTAVDDAPKDPCFRDIVSVTLAAGKETTAKLIQLYQLWGMRLRGKGGQVSLESTDLAIHLVPETASARGIQQIEFRLNRPPADSSSRRFGQKSVLSFHGKFGTWTF